MGDLVGDLVGKCIVGFVCAKHKRGTERNIYRAHNGCPCSI